MRRPEPWTIADLLDFEYLLATDAEMNEARLRERDQSLVVPDPGPRPLDRHTLFRRWLEARRRSTADPLPGEYFRTGWQTLLTLAALVGTGLGISLTAGLLHYRGEEPVNVAWFFAATVGVQLLLLTSALVIWLLRRATGVFDDFRPLQALLTTALQGLSAGLRRLPGEQRDRLRTFLSTLRHRREIYGSLTAWPLLVVTQLFGVCFNVGVLATLLLHVALSDVAFGWQSTLRTSPGEAYQLVSAVAAPWSFAPHPHPTFDQVVASRFAYSSGIQPLSAAAMASWWPFLCYAVAGYGLLVRTLLLGWATVKGRRALAAIKFDHHGCNALYRRLAGPLIHAGAEGPALEIPAPAGHAQTHAAGVCFALVAAEIALEPAQFAETLRQRYGWQLRETRPVPVDHPSGSRPALAELEKAAPTLAGVAVLVPARRPPIKAIALFLQQTVRAAGPRVEVLVFLIGRREGDGFTAVSDEDFAHWRNFNAIHGLHLGLEKWPAS